MTGRRIERTRWLQAAAEARCSAVTAASPAVFLMTLLRSFSRCLSLFFFFSIFHINPEFEKRGWHGTVRVPDCEAAPFFFSPPPLDSIFFLRWAAHWGERRVFLLCGASPPPRWCRRTPQGPHSPGPCLPGIMQSLMDSAQGRQGREG